MIICLSSVAHCRQ